MTHDPFLHQLQQLGGLAGTSGTDDAGRTTVRLRPGDAYPDVTLTLDDGRILRDVRAHDASDTDTYAVLTVDDQNQGVAVRSAVMIGGQVRASPPKARYGELTEHVTCNDARTPLPVTYDRDWWMTWAHLISGLHALRSRPPITPGDARQHLLDLLSLDPRDTPRRRADQARIQAARTAVQAGQAPDEPLAFAAFYASLGPTLEA